MSLLHQVLQDIDQRTDKRVPLPEALMIDNGESEKRWQPITFTLFLAALALLLVWNSADSPDSVYTENLVAPITTMNKQSAGSAVLSESPDALSVTLPDTKTREVAVAAKTAAVPTEDEPVSVTSVSVTSAPVAPESASPDSKTQIKTPALAAIEEPRTLPATVVVERKDDSAQVQYLAALNALKLKQYPQALTAIDAALSLSEQPLYQAVKLRIFLEQRNASAFIQYYQQHSDINHVRWLSVAGPGLHILKHPQLAVTPYQQLIVAQPEVVNWPLALASAWEEQGQTAPAAAVLKNVIAHYQLTPQQRAWVSRKIEVLGGKSGA